eukprot:1409612-Prymnesium_polylepis.2
MAVLFVIDILILVVFIWGAVFGAGVIDPNPACDVFGKGLNVTYAGNNQYPPKVDGVYVADYCNLNQRMFNVCIK